MLNAGLPSSDAIMYFVETEDPKELAFILAEWQKSMAVKKAMLNLMGKAWQDMSLDEQCTHALNQHYASLAYYLYSHNYSEVGSHDKPKIDTARVALEARQAGTAGKGDALSVFFEDLRSGKVKLNKPVGASPIFPAVGPKN